MAEWGRDRPKPDRDKFSFASMRDQLFQSSDMFAELTPDNTAQKTSGSDSYGQEEAHCGGPGSGIAKYGDKAKCGGHVREKVNSGATGGEEEVDSAIEVHDVSVQFSDSAQCDVLLQPEGDQASTAKVIQTMYYYY